LAGCGEKGSAKGGYGFLARRTALDPLPRQVPSIGGVGARKLKKKRRGEYRQNNSQSKPPDNPYARLLQANAKNGRKSHLKGQTQHKEIENPPRYWRGLFLNQVTRVIAQGTSARDRGGEEYQRENAGKREDHARAAAVGQRHEPGFFILSRRHVEYLSEALTLNKGSSRESTKT